MRETMKYDTNIYQLRETVLRRMLQIAMERKYSNENGIVFFGDSIIEYFDLQTHLKSTCSMYNCGIAGASTSILKNYIDEAVLKYRPQQVFIMAGTNDLGNTEMASPRDIAMNMKEISEIIHYNLPECQIVLCSPIPCVESIHGYQTLKMGLRSHDVLKMIEKEYKRIIPYDYVTIVNIFDCLCLENGETDQSYYIDGLHIDERGYSKIAEVLQSYIKK